MFDFLALENQEKPVVLAEKYFSAGLQVPFVCSETHELGEELVASYFYQIHLYHWLESNDYGRFLSDNDI